MTHELKTWTGYYQAILDGKKTFECRRDDRGFNYGDGLLLREWNTDDNTYTGRQVLKTVTYILRGPAFGVSGGFCVMALGEPDMHDTPEYQAFVEESAKHCVCCEYCGNSRPCDPVLAGGSCEQACRCAERDDDYP